MIPFEEYGTMQRAIINNLSKNKGLLNKITISKSTEDIKNSETDRSRLRCLQAYFISIMTLNDDNQLYPSPLNMIKFFLDAWVSIDGKYIVTPILVQGMAQE